LILFFNILLFVFLKWIWIWLLRLWEKLVILFLVLWLEILSEKLLIVLLIILRLSKIVKIPHIFSWLLLLLLILILSEKCKIKGLVLFLLILNRNIEVFENYILLFLSILDIRICLLSLYFLWLGLGNTSASEIRIIYLRITRVIFYLWILPIQSCLIFIENCVIKCRGFFISLLHFPLWFFLFLNARYLLFFNRLLSRRLWLLNFFLEIYLFC
jgi:hypothetical protein